MHAAEVWVTIQFLYRDWRATTRRCDMARCGAQYALRHGLVNAATRRCARCDTALWALRHGAVRAATRRCARCDTALCALRYGAVRVTPRFPVRSDWRIRTGFRDARLRTGTLYLIIIFFLNRTGACGYGPHLKTESKFYIQIKELPPKWCPSNLYTYN